MQRGSNLDGVRRYNERLALATIRRRNGASKTDIANATGLSAQAAVRIVDALEAAQLVVRTGKRTGGLGQPSILYEVNGDGGFTVGVEIGRERLTLVLLNYRGEVLDRHIQPVDFPVPGFVLEQTAVFVDRQLARLSAEKRSSFLGIGIAMPWFIGEWRQEIGISEAQAGEWERADVEQMFRSRFSHPLFFENDGNAGALAELLTGAGLQLESYLYLHIGTFIGGGLVLRGQLEEGRHGNAGAIASMPVPSADRSGTDYLLHKASRYMLEKALGAATGIDASFDDMVTSRSQRVNEWLADCAKALAFVIIGANSLLDLQAIIMDGDLPPQLIAQVMSAVEQHIAQSRPLDFFAPDLVLGTMRDMAPAIGAGLLPMYATFSPNLATLLKNPKV
ncbi:ROK family transcriptional regulator [Sphingobium terrigena]|uniref:ROK family transcriptional regulator n=1 Tax=Sphingobium terrigena TaxID=2304063 RepID=A0A418YVY7_9SPHN|nr:ROK family transcriptional regulator [Sphingobium terrigena]RJG56528.1 ROK family transcriptional regulator [Sphingobium terrigena]